MSKREVAAVAEAMVEQAQAERGPPILRPKTGKRLRPIVAVDAEGKPVKVVTHGDLVQGLVAREGVWIAVQAGRPPWFICRCNRCVKVPRKGVFPRACKVCVKRETERGRVRSAESLARKSQAQTARVTARRLATRPTSTTCSKCGKTLAVSPTGGPPPTRCPPCRRRDNAAAWRQRQKASRRAAEPDGLEGDPGTENAFTERG